VASSRSYAVARRLTLSPPTLKAVSFIPSGSADPLAQGIPEGHASGAGDEHARHVGGDLVHPALTRW
jgi:hypothetical protein